MLTLAKFGEAAPHSCTPPASRLQKLPEHLLDHSLLLIRRACTGTRLRDPSSVAGRNCSGSTPASTFGIPH